MAKKRYQSPAKIKYDKSHPIVSVRTTPDLKKKLEDIKIMSDKNPADILKETVGLQTPSTKNAYDKGYLMAQLKYAVSYKCSVCGKVITITTKDEKEAVAQYMKKEGWAHRECPNK